MVTSFPVPSTPPLPMPVDAILVDSDARGDNINVTVGSSAPSDMPNPSSADGPQQQHQLDIGMCITAIKVGGGVEAGMYFRFFDADV